MPVSRKDITGLILCGGQSSRFGSPKSHFVFEGATLVERAAGVLAPHVETVCLAVGESSGDEWPPIDLVWDLTPGLGPIGGLQAGVGHLQTDWMFVLAVDLPFMTDEAIMRITASARKDDLAVVARDSEDRVHPLCGLYHRDTRDQIDRTIQSKQLSMRALLFALDSVRYVTLPSETLRNVNRPADFS